MPYRKTKFQAGQVYHLYNRGVNRQPIFFCAENWGFMLRLFRRHFRPDLIDILAYCLMPNHYHLMVRLKVDDFGKQVMQPWGVSYTKAVNKQQGRVGPIFQGPFQAVHVARDEQMMHLSRYIHRNPVEAGLVTTPQAWSFSSYKDYIGLREGTLPQPDDVLALFPSREAYRQFVEADQDSSVIAGILLD
jgi:REP element-mobilizing transposase RayT